MKVSFLILNYKSYNDTIKVVNELLEFDSTTFDYDIVVVDNKSPNESFETIKNEFKMVSKVIVIEAPYNGGYSKGNNVGLRYLQSHRPDYVCIMNNDVHFCMDIIECMIELDQRKADGAFFSPIQMLPNGKPAIFQSLRQPTFGDDVKSYMPILYSRERNKWQYEPTDINNHLQEVDIVPGALLFINFDKFEKMGFFDESTFLFCEERFTSHLVTEHRLKNYLVLNKTYLHEHSKTINSEASKLNQLKWLHDGKIAFTKKYRNYALWKVMILNILYQLKKLELKTILQIQRKG